MQHYRFIRVVFLLIAFTQISLAQHLSEFEQLLPADERGLLFGLARNASVVSIAEDPSGNYLLTERNGCYLMPHGQSPDLEINVLPADRRDQFTQLFNNGNATYLWANGHQLIKVNGDVEERLSFIGDHFARNVSPNSIAIDPFERIIVGTATDGIFIFRPDEDGNYFDIPVRVSTMDQQLPSNKINCLFRDQRGIIWIGTDAGVATFYGDSVYNLSQPTIIEAKGWWQKLFGYSEIIPAYDDPVKAITQWGNSILFFSEETGVTKVAAQPDSLQQVYSFPINERLTTPMTDVKGMITDINGDVWIFGDQLVRYNITTDQLTQVSNNLRFRGRGFTALHEDLARNCMWIGTKRGGLYRFDF